jgi:hypothetical protein
MGLSGVEGLWGSMRIFLFTDEKGIWYILHSSCCYSSTALANQMCGNILLLH